MKKYDIVKNFFIGGCIGFTLMNLSYYIVNFIMKNINQTLLNSIRDFFIIFFFGGIIYILAVISIRSLKYKDMKFKNKQKVLSRQMILLSAVIIIFSGALLGYSVIQNMLGIILSMSFILVFALWGYGCLLEYISLKKNMVMIKKKE